MGRGLEWGDCSARGGSACGGRRGRRRGGGNEISRR